MQVWLYRRRLSLLSGAGQLVLMQAEGLERTGVRATLAAERGRLKFLLRSGRYVRPLAFASARSIAAREQSLFVDHSAQIPEADLVFVHNHAAAAARYLGADGADDSVEREARFYAQLSAQARLVANSELVRAALSEDYGIAAERIEVLHPGFRANRFNPRVRSALRPRSRRALGIGDDVPLIGFVTSGNLRKRGIDCLAESAALIAAERPDARFLVVGSTRPPRELTELDLFRRGTMLYRPRSARPEAWFAALDLFLFPAVWEEFGMVVIEAIASGLPVLTSRRVGAAECLPPPYASWISPAPDAAAFAALGLRLLGARPERQQLIEAGTKVAASLSDRSYGDAAARLVLAQNRRLK